MNNGKKLAWIVCMLACLMAVQPSKEVKAGSTDTVQVRFTLNGEMVSLERAVPSGLTPLEAAIKAQVAGLSMQESANGVTSAIPAGVKLVKLSVSGDTVSVDMSPEVVANLDEAGLEAIFNQFKATLGDFPWVAGIRLTCKGRLLSSYLPISPEVGPAALPLERTQGVGLTGLGGRNITIGPSHGRYWNGSGWYWQRSDPCGYGEAVLEDTNSIRLCQFLYQYLAQDGATVHVPRELNESNCCNGDTGLPWWKMCAQSWLRANGLPCTVWGTYSNNCGGDTAADRLNDDIRARPKFADYRGSDIYIAHHTNAGGGTGTETFRDTAMENPAHETNSYNLALSVHNNTIDAIRDMYDSGWANRGVKDSNGGFGEIRIPNRPAILIELAFHDKCGVDASYLTDDFFRSVAEWGLYKGICAYFGTSPTWDKYSDEYVSDTIPSTMNAGQSYNVSITFRNRGVLWREGRAFRLGAVGDSDPFTSSTRFTISGDVRPGNTYTFNFTMLAPSTPGTYTTDWRMVRDGVAWFGATHSEQVQVVPTHPYQKGWMLIGPYSSSSIETNSLGVSESSLYPWSGASLNGKSWINYDSSGNYIDLDSALGAADNVTSYASSYVYTSTAKSVYIRCGSDDQLKIWLNGTLVHTYSDARGHVYDQDNIGPVTLNAGWNRVLVKVHDNAGAFGFSFRFSDDSSGSSDTSGLTWQKDDTWTPSQLLSSVYGVAGNPTPNADFYGNNPTVNFAGTASNGTGPVPWTVRYYKWGSTNTYPGPGWGAVSGSPNSSSWTHSENSIGGHVRWHFQNLTNSGKTTTEWNNTGGSNYVDVFVDSSAPNAPSIDTVTTTSASSLNLTWTVPSDQGSGPGSTDGATEAINESSSDINANWYRVGNVGVQVRRDSIAGPVVADWVTGNSGDDTGLAANTLFSYYIQARDNTSGTRGAWNNTTSWVGPVTGRTHIETPGLTLQDITETSIKAVTSGTLTNISTGQSATRIVNQTLVTDSGWTANAHTTWDNSALTTNKQYTFHAEARNADGVSAPEGAPQSKYTLAPAPTSSNVTCDKAINTTYPGSAVFTFTNTLGFGVEGKPSELRYVWNTDPTYSFGGSEAQWISAVKELTPSGTGNWYLHLQSVNADGLENNQTADLGPYVVDATNPGPPTAINGTGAGGVITLMWEKGVGAATTRIERSTSDSGPWTIVEPAAVGTTWTDPASYSPGDIRWYRLTSVSGIGNLSVSNPVIGVMCSMSGVNIWNYSTMAATLAPPSLMPNLEALFAGSNDEYLHTFSSTGGTARFAPYRTGGAISARAPVAFAGGKYIVFCGSQDTNVYAVNASTWAPEWSVSLGTGNQVVAKVAGQSNTALTVGPFAGQNRMVIIAATYNTGARADNFVRALDGLTGQTDWTFAPGNMDLISGAPSIYPSTNTAVVASYAGVDGLQPSLWAIDTRSGALKWSLNLGHIASSPTISLDGSALYVCNNGGTLYKVDMASHSVVWTFELGAALYGAPWLDSGVLYLASTNNRVWSIIDNGASAQANPSWGGGTGWVPVVSPSAPVLSNIADKLYVGSSDGKMWEIALATGAGLFLTVGPNNMTLGDPVVDYYGARLYSGSSTGRIYAWTIPFIRADLFSIYGMEIGTGALVPDGPFNPFGYYSLKAKTVWRGLGPGTHVQTVRWLTPGGQLYQEFTTYFSASGDGYPQDVWITLPIAGTNAQRILGTWTVQVYLDGTETLQATKTFTFTSN